MAKKPAAGEKGDKGAEALGGVAATPAGTAAIKRAAGGAKTAVTKAVKKAVTKVSAAKPVTKAVATAKKAKTAVTKAVVGKKPAAKGKK